jgi:hypothetical protein
VPGRVKNVARIISDHSIEITIETLAQAFGERRILVALRSNSCCFPALRRRWT